MLQSHKTLRSCNTSLPSVPGIFLLAVGVFHKAGSYSYGALCFEPLSKACPRAKFVRIDSPAPEGDERVTGMSSVCDISCLNP